MAGMSPTGSAAQMEGMAGMPMASGNGLSAMVNGYSLKLVEATGPAEKPTDIRFTISSNGQPITAFDPEQTKLMHFYLIRSDLSGFQHLHPTMDAVGTWSVTAGAEPAGSYRIYVQFIPHVAAAAGALILSTPLTLGTTAAAETLLPAAGTTAEVDGYTVEVSGALKAGTESALKVTMSKAGKQVTDLQPYLATYAHITAIRAGNLAFAHIHPDGGAATGNGGPTLLVHADLPEPGSYRMFIQFQTNGILHTAALTILAS